MYNAWLPGVSCDIIHETVSNNYGPRTESAKKTFEPQPIEVFYNIII